MTQQLIMEILVLLWTATENSKIGVLFGNEEHQQTNRIRRSSFQQPPVFLHTIINPSFNVFDVAVLDLIRTLPKSCLDFIFSRFSQEFKIEEENGKEDLYFKKKKEKLQEFEKKQNTTRRGVVRAKPPLFFVKLEEEDPDVF